MSRFLLALVVSGLLLSTSGQAEMYRWVNEDGVTVYSQLPPPDHRQADVVKPPPPPPTGAETLPSVDDQLKQIQEQKAARQKVKSRQAELREWHAKRQANCDAARRNLQVLQGPTRRLVATPGADYERLTEERRQEMIQEAKDQIEEFCTRREP
jgi:hypothetical protein